MTKEDMLEAVRELPEETSYDDAIQLLLFLHDLEVSNAAQGRTLWQGDTKARIRLWLDEHQK